jgi:hypothetical protein
MFEYEVGVEETMSRARVDQCRKRRTDKGGPTKALEVSGIVRELEAERADVLSLTSLVAQMGSTQPSARAEAGGLLTIFLSPPRELLWTFLRLVSPHILWLCWQKKWL